MWIDNVLCGKKWTVHATSESFLQQFAWKTCVGGHEQIVIEDVTARASCYPVALCRAVARHWKHDLTRDSWSKAQLLGFLQGDHSVSAEEVEHWIMAAEKEPTEQETADLPKTIIKVHRASGHGSMLNIRRLLKDAKKESWKI